MTAMMTWRNEIQLDERSEDEIKAKQGELSTLYDRFSAEYGLINSQANSRAFNADSAYYLLCSLEILDEDGNLERKADMFSKRTIKPKTTITHRVGSFVSLPVLDYYQLHSEPAPRFFVSPHLLSRQPP